MIAAQLYTLREHLKTPDQIAATLRKVREIGYEAVQLSALGPIETGRLKEILDENGLAVCATHIAWERLQNDIQGVIDEHRTLGCRHVAIGSMPPAYRNEEGYHRFAKEASEVAKALDGAGMTFSYHNHHFELERFGSKTGLDILIEESDPLLKFEIDTYWIQYGGGDPAAWIRKVGGRNPLVHLKDLTVKNAECAWPKWAKETSIGRRSWPRAAKAASNGTSSSKTIATAIPLRAWRSASTTRRPWGLAKARP